MDGFLVSYSVLVVIGLLAFIGFWGVVIYSMVDFFLEESDLPTQKNLDFANKDKSSLEDHHGREILIKS